MYGIDTTDVRVINIQGSVMSQGSVAELDFTTPSRTNITQDIPIINQSNDEWTVKVKRERRGWKGFFLLIIFWTYHIHRLLSKDLDLMGL